MSELEQEGTYISVLPAENGPKGKLKRVFHRPHNNDTSTRSIIPNALPNLAAWPKQTKCQLLHLPSYTSRTLATLYNPVSLSLSFLSLSFSNTVRRKKNKSGGFQLLVTKSYQAVMAPEKKKKKRHYLFLNHPFLGFSELAKLPFPIMSYPTTFEDIHSTGNYQRGSLSSKMKGRSSSINVTHIQWCLQSGNEIEEHHSLTETLEADRMEPGNSSYSSFLLFGEFRKPFLFVSNYSSNFYEFKGGEEGIRYHG